MPDDVFINNRAAVHAGSQGQSIAFPDVCLCPPTPPAGPIPTPLPNTVMAADLAGGAPSVLTGGNPTGKQSSYFAKSTGNEVAQPTGGGVVSHTVQGKAYFQSFSPNVFIEGEPAVRHLDMLTHNHLVQPGNTPPTVWLSTMDVALPGDPGPPGLVTNPTRLEGRLMVRVFVIDELGEPVGTAFKLTTPSGQTVEDRLLWGGFVCVTGLAKGKCRLVLADIDQLCREYHHPQPAEAGDGQTAYRPGSPLELAAGERHQVVVPAFRTLWIDVPRITDDETLVTDQRFTLSSDDGRYGVERTVADDRGGDDELFTLAFPGLFPGPKYTLAHHDGQRAAGDVFTAQSFAALFPPAPDGEGELFVHGRRSGRSEEVDRG